MINLLYCGNNKVFDGMLISVISILKYTKAAINVYVLTMDLQEVDEKHKPVTAKQTEFIEKLLRQVNSQSTVKLIDVTQLFNSEMQNCINIENFYTPYCLLRLFSDKVAELPDKLLYLDTDTVAMGDIEPLYNTDIENYEFAAAIDYLGKFFLMYKRLRYMNSGVMLMNLPAIRKTRLFEKARITCKTKKMAFPDQDALNKYVKKRKFLSSRYNDQRRLHKNTVIRHFCKSLRIFPYIHTINVKPWELERLHSALKVYYIDDIIKEYQMRLKEFNG